jgi:hypothetical protein
MVVVAVDEHRPDDRRAWIGRARHGREVDEGRPRQPGSLGLADPVPRAERSGPGRRASFDRLGVPGQAGGNVVVRARRVHDDRQLARDAPDQAGYRGALQLRVVVGAQDHRELLGRGDDDEVGAKSDEAIDDPLAPRFALRVFALEARRPDAHVHEDAAELRERDEPPAALPRQQIDRREPMSGMGIADESDRNRAAGVAVDAGRRLRSG